MDDQGDSGVEVPETKLLISKVWPSEPYMNSNPEGEKRLPFDELVEIGHVLTLPHSEGDGLDEQVYHAYETMRFRIRNLRWARYVTVEDALCYLWEFLDRLHQHVDEREHGEMGLNFNAEPMLMMAYGIIQRYRVEYASAFSNGGLMSLILNALYIASLRTGKACNVAQIHRQIRRICTNHEARDDLLRVAVAGTYLSGLVLKTNGDCSFVPWQSLFTLGTDLITALKKGESVTPALEAAVRKNSCFNLRICPTLEVPDWLREIVDTGFTCPYDDGCTGAC